MTIYIEDNQFANEVKNRIRDIVNGDTALHISSTPIVVPGGDPSIKYFQVTYRPANTLLASGQHDLGKALLDKLGNISQVHIFIHGALPSFQRTIPGRTPDTTQHYRLNEEGGLTESIFTPPHVDLYIDGTQTRYPIVLEGPGFNSTEKDELHYVLLFHELLHAEGLIDNIPHSHPKLIPKVNDFRTQRNLGYEREEPWCFIVSAATGSATSETVETLQQLRNQLLRANSIGHAIEYRTYTAYMRFSPGVAQQIERSVELRQMVLTFFVNPFIDFLILARDYALAKLKPQQMRRRIAAVRHRFDGHYTCAEISRISEVMASWGGRLASPTDPSGAVSYSLAWQPATIEDVLDYLLASINARAPNDPYIIWGLARPLTAMWEVIADRSPFPERLFVDHLYAWLRDLPVPREVYRLPPETLAKGLDELGQSFLKDDPLRIILSQRLFANAERSDGRRISRRSEQTSMMTRELEC